MPGVRERNLDLILRSVETAQSILARHVEPGGPDERDTINELLGVLDDRRLVMAMRAERPLAEERARQAAA